MTPQITHKQIDKRAKDIFARLFQFSPLIICVYFLLLTVNYARVTPIFEASDEAAHFLNIYTLAEEGELPRILSREQIAVQTRPTKLWAIETHQPPLYYATAAPLVAAISDLNDINTFLRSNDLIFIKGVLAANHNKWLHSPERSSDDTYRAVIAVRGLSMLMGIGTLLCVYASAFLVFDDRVKATAAMLLVASIPTFVAISASVNNDNLVTLLYSIGIYWCLRTWKYGIGRFDEALIAGILAAIALTKLSGLSLFVIVYGVLIVGVWRKRYPRAQALRVIVVSLVAVTVFAGWWYARNLDLYGDPLALAATQALWGREYEVAATSGEPLEELVRIGRSFWLMIGHLHLPVYGPDWFYGYAGVSVLLAIMGGLAAVLRRTRSASASFQQDGLFFSLIVCGIVGFTLLFGTRSVDISYGRLLFPALVGFAILVVWGIGVLIENVLFNRLFTKGVARYAPTIGMSILLLPLIGMTIYTPLGIIPTAYAQLESVAHVPLRFVPLDVSAETINLSGYRIPQKIAHREGHIEFELIFQGAHEQNPALLVTVIDAITLERLGHVEVYPGMAPTDTLDPAQLYRAKVRIPLNEIGDAVLSPRGVRVQVAWYSPSAFRDIPMINGEAAPIDVLLLDGPLLLDDRYNQPQPEVKVSARFGDAIQLQGFEISKTNVQPGDSIQVETLWQALDALDEDWNLTVQLVDRNNNLLAQADGELPGLPTVIWEKGMQTIETRTLLIPEDAETGEYRLLVGWYRLSDFMRLPVVETEGTAQDNLVELEIVSVGQ